MTRPTRVVGASLHLQGSHPRPRLVTLTPFPADPQRIFLSRLHTMAPPQVVQLYKEIQKVFVSGNLQQTGVLLTKLKVGSRSPTILSHYLLDTAHIGGCV